MIVYRELSSLSHDLGFSGKALYGVSYRISRHYHPVMIPKSSGGSRQLYVPDSLLKAIQTRIAKKLLPMEKVSPFATAYRQGGSTRLNASAHVGKPVVVKLDIRRFFDHIIYPMVKEKAFPARRYSESNRILLTMLCVYNDTLPQGAPTSPVISNIVMRDFDNRVGKWCAEKSISYTRYCDDMTFSGEFDPKELISFVRVELRKMGFFLNDGKTTVVRQGQLQQITGIVVNEKASVPAHYKRSIRQEIYYCGKYGITSHLEMTESENRPREYLQNLLGRINYVLSVEPGNREFERYKATAAKWMRELS